MSAGGSPVDVPAEYRATVEAVLQREPPLQHDAAADVLPAEDGRFSLRRFLRPYRWKLALAFVIVVTSTFVNNIGPLIFAKAIDHGIVGKDFDVLLLLSLVYLGTVMLRIALRYASTLYIGFVGQELLFRLRNRVFAHLQRLSYDYHNKTKSGHTLAVLTSDINTLSTVLQDGLINLIVQALVLFIITAVLFYMNATLALILLAAAIPPTLITTLWFKKTSTAKFRHARARSADVIADLRQSLYGMRQIHIFNRAPVNIGEHGAIVDKYQRANDDSAKLTSLYSAITDFIEIGAQAVVLYFGFQLVLGKTLTIGELIAFALFLNRFFGPMEQLALLFREYQTARAAVDKISRFLSIKPSIGESADAAPLQIGEGSIEFHRVSFGYDAAEPVLEGVDIAIRGGETLAVVGPTGGGKSTLVKLLCRLLDPGSGHIRIDGQDIRQVTLASLRRQIGVVPQDGFLFHGSLRDNIAFANPDADAEQILAACRSACLDDVIARLPHGLDSSVFEQGSSLSAGERQLVAISRLFLSEPRIIVMDEAMSHVDPKTELHIEQALLNLSRGRTTIVVTHRLGRIRRADRIMVVGERRVLELGTHDELIARQGLYAAMQRSS